MIIFISLVLKSLEVLATDKKAYRMVGGVLVQKTVGEVVPEIKENRESVFFIVLFQLLGIIGKLNEQVKGLQKDLTEFEVYNINYILFEQKLHNIKFNPKDNTISIDSIQYLLYIFIASSASQSTGVLA